MLISGDVVELDLGQPEGREEGFRHPGVLVTAQRILDRRPNVVQIVPLTTSVRDFDSEVVVTPEPENGLDRVSSAQCQHVRAVSPGRLLRTRGNVGPVVLGQIRETLALIFDLP
jgi:mRNA interferase MazF